MEGNILPQITSYYDRVSPIGSSISGIGSALGGGTSSGGGINTMQMGSALGQALQAIQPVQRQALPLPTPGSPMSPISRQAGVDPAQMLQYLMSLRNQLPPQTTAYSHIRGA